MPELETTYKVGVEVTNFPQDYRLVSTLKTYLVDPTATPPYVELIGPDPTVEVIEIFSPNDSAMVISRSTPKGSVTTTNSAIPPDDSIVLSAGNSGISRFLHGPGPLWAVGITGNTVSRVCVIVTRRVPRNA